MHAFSCAKPRCMRKPWKRQMRTYLDYNTGLNLGGEGSSVAVNVVISGFLSHCARTGAHPFFQCVRNMRRQKKHEHESF